MAVADAVTEILGTDNFADYERSVYESYQKKAEREIINTLNSLLSSEAFLVILKAWGAKCGCKSHGFRDISIRLKSGRKRKIHSPVFLKAKPKKRGRNPKRQKGRLRHLGLELLGIIKKVTPALVEICVSMAVLCPSFDVATNDLQCLGIEMNQNLLQNITRRFAEFQYKAFQDSGLPTGSGSIESAIRRVINLRVKGTGMFWKKANAENVIFLRSLVLTGKLRNACRKACGIVEKMFHNDIIEDLPMAA